MDNFLATDRQAVQWRTVSISKQRSSQLIIEVMNLYELSRQIHTRDTLSLASCQSVSISGRLDSLMRTILLSLPARATAVVGVWPFSTHCLCALTLGSPVYWLPICSALQHEFALEPNLHLIERTLRLRLKLAPRSSRVETFSVIYDTS